MPNNPFEFGGERLMHPAKDAFDITPSDSADLSTYARSLYIGGAGDVNLDTVQGTTIVFHAVPAGTILPVGVRRVRSTSTTATDIIGLV